MSDEIGNGKSILSGYRLPSSYTTAAMSCLVLVALMKARARVRIFKSLKGLIPSSLPLTGPAITPTIVHMLLQGERLDFYSLGDKPGHYFLGAE